MEATAGVGIAVLQFAASVIIAGLLFGPALSLTASLRKVETKILSDRSSQFVDLTHATVQNVARGVIGVALLQTILASVG